MQARNAANVLPDPVGAEMSVERPATMCGHPSSCGSVGVPNFCTNQACTNGCAQASACGISCGTCELSELNCMKKLAYRGRLNPLGTPLANHVFDGSQAGCREHRRL